GIVGEFPSMVIGSDGYPAISFYDRTNKQIKLAHCLNKGCTSHDLTVIAQVDDGGATAQSMGNWSAIAIGTDGLPLVMYTSSTGSNAAVNYKHCRTLSCSSMDAEWMVDSVSGGGGPGMLGAYIHGVVPSDGRPFFAYYHPSFGLRGVKFLTATTTPNTFQIENFSDSNSGKYLDIKINRNGLPIVAYYYDSRTMSAQLKTATCTASPCSSNSNFSINSISADTAFPYGGLGPWVSMIIGSDGLPAITYQRFNSLSSQTELYSIECSVIDCSTNVMGLMESSPAGFASGTSAVRLQDGTLGVATYRVDTGDLQFDRTCNGGSCSLLGGLSGSSLGNVTNYFYRIYGREIYAKQAYLSGFDLAESYVTEDPTLVAGDVVAMDESGAAKVVKADRVTHPIVMGVVSTKPGLLLTEWADKDLQTVPVALAGRVPVSVSLENGPIHAGDPLTLSSTPGVAMKAITAGNIIGRALESYSSSTNASTTSILVFVSPGYNADIGVEGANALNLSASSSTTARLQNTGSTPETILSSAALYFSEMRIGKLVVNDAAFTGNVLLAGTTTIRGPVVFGQTNAGRVEIMPQTEKLSVDFQNPYPVIPHVFVTPEMVPEPDAQGVDASTWDGGYFLDYVTTTGFEIRLPRGGYCVSYTHCPVRLWFNWFVVGYEGETSTNSGIPAVSSTIDTTPVTTINPESTSTLSEPTGSATTTTTTTTQSDAVVPVVEEPATTSSTESVPSDLVPMTTTTTDQTTDQGTSTSTETSVTDSTQSSSQMVEASVSSTTP
ncbi:MAG TPA: hypothetical protein VFQ60_04260, partial [Patescibacteria group bacterium]|nr:hypothetical protein [Patescibacteria group bacterium]